MSENENSARFRYRPRMCDYGGHWLECLDQPNMGDDPCTGPRAVHACSYSYELRESDDDVKRCNCCEACTHECALNV